MSSAGTGVPNRAATSVRRTPFTVTSPLGAQRAVLGHRPASSREYRELAAIAVATLMPVVPRDTLAGSLTERARPLLGGLLVHVWAM